MRRTLATLLLAACVDTGSIDVPDGFGTAGNEPSGNTPTRSDTGRPPTFEQGRYRLRRLQLLDRGQSWDLDGDGAPDNEVAAILEDLAIHGLTVSQVNELVQDGLETGVNVVLLEAERWEDDTFVFTMLKGLDEDGGLAVDPRSLRADGRPREQNFGRMPRAGEWTAGPGILSLPITVVDDFAVLDIVGHDTKMRGQVDPSVLQGTFAAKFPVDTVMTGVVDPLMAFLDADQAALWRPTIEAAVALRADQDVDGEPALSAAFAFRSTEAVWAYP